MIPICMWIGLTWDARRHCTVYLPGVIIFLWSFIIINKKKGQFWICVCVCVQVPKHDSVFQLNTISLLFFFLFMCMYECWSMIADSMLQLGISPMESLTSFSPGKLGPRLISWRKRKDKKGWEITDAGGGDVRCIKNYVHISHRMMNSKFIVLYFLLKILHHMRNK